ncbi:aminoacetone oxidase family FAD-binding enzyme [Helicobacter valdiviensis]|uniref:aminoacetone oxidase family FAD-binding enzyme n=1 Tax=Helicobacter valdiviensis TaxID=1458358 RepID=UPI0024831A6D|nr:aminoacetone oxidase family FAD-binding enzyme [Helicobacter valdiviensis]
MVGGGASGIFCAILLASSGFKVSIYEKNKILGKKLQATGNGRCNIHNTHLNSTNYHSSTLTSQEIKKIFENFSYKQFNKKCLELGLLLKAQEDGRVYPISQSAKSVMEVFNFFIQKYQIKVFLEQEIKTVEKYKDKYILNHNKSKLLDFLILSCGSEAHSKLGGSDSGFVLAKSLGINVVKTYPALVPLECQFKFLEELSGNKIEAKITLRQNNKIQKEIVGDVLFTNYGLSGFGILDISLFIKEGCEIVLDFFPTLELKELENIFIIWSKCEKNKKLEEILVGIINPKMAKIFSKMLKDSIVHTKSLKQMAYLLKNFIIKNPKLRGFEGAEVSGGGVSFLEVSMDFESKQYSNLFIVGEMLDIVGDRGGYNLAFVWASATICCNHIVKIAKISSKKQ